MWTQFTPKAARKASSVASYLRWLMVWIRQSRGAILGATSGVVFSLLAAIAFLQFVFMSTKARREFDEAADGYEQRRAGLGTKFRYAVERVLDQAAVNPGAIC